MQYRWQFVILHCYYICHHGGDVDGDGDGDGGWVSRLHSTSH